MQINGNDYNAKEIIKIVVNGLNLHKVILQN